MNHPKDKPVTITTIAKALNVSPQTVSSVLGGMARTRRISEATAQRVQEMARRLNYVPNELARSLRRRRSCVVGVIGGNMSEGWAERILVGMQRVLDPVGYTSLFAMSRWDAEREWREMRSFLERRCDGIIVCVPLGDGEENYREVIRRGVPLLFLTDTLKSMPEVSSVTWDSPAAVRLAVDHLVATGRRRIAFLGQEFPTVLTRKRFEAWQAALQAHNLAAEPDWIAWDTITKPAEHGAIEALAGRLVDRVMAGSVAQRPDALFVLNDALALPVLAALHERGIRVPRDVAVVGMGDLPHTGHPGIGLTTVEEPCEQMGEEGARTILELIEHPEKAPIQRVIQWNRLKARRTTHVEAAAL